MPVLALVLAFVVVNPSAEDSILVDRARGALRQRAWAEAESLGRAPSRSGRPALPSPFPGRGEIRWPPQRRRTRDPGSMAALGRPQLSSSGRAPTRSAWPRSSRRAARARLEQGRWRQAGTIDQARAAHGILRRQRPDDEVDLAASAMTLARLLRRAGEYEDARIYFEESLRIKEARLGPRDLEVAKAYGNLGIVQNDLGDGEAALKNYLHVLRICEEIEGPDGENVSGAL